MRTIIQLHNLVSFNAIMLLDNDLLTTSPDYFKEKSFRFFGFEAKNSFIEYPKHKTFSKYTELPIDYNANFWDSYVKLWKIDKDDFRTMNILNYIFNLAPINFNSWRGWRLSPIKINDSFKMFVGDSNKIHDYDYIISSVHPLFLEIVDEYIDYYGNQRFVKLLILKEKGLW